jgi:hypothetical protein
VLTTHLHNCCSLATDTWPVQQVVCPVSFFDASDVQDSISLALYRIISSKQTNRDNRLSCNSLLWYLMTICTKVQLLLVLHMCCAGQLSAGLLVRDGCLRLQSLVASPAGDSSHKVSVHEVCCTALAMHCAHYGSAAQLDAGRVQIGACIAVALIWLTRL